MATIKGIDKMLDNFLFDPDSIPNFLPTKGCSTIWITDLNSEWLVPENFKGLSYTIMV